MGEFGLIASLRVLSMEFFETSNYHTLTILCNLKNQVKQVLKSGGAAREFYISDLVTHVIATDTSFPQFGEAKEYNLTIVQVLFFCLLVWETSKQLCLP